ncbi:hypothetical protein ACFCT7_04310 [Fulvivirgaceae bacterium LMO-SS25]
MTRTIGDYLLIILSIIGSFASIFAYAEYIGPKLNDQGIFGVAIVGIFAFIFFGYSLYLVSKYRNKVRYAEVFEDINIGFAAMHSLDRKDEMTLDDLAVALIGVCDGLSNAFSKINGHKIGVCIKHLEFDNGHALVKTLVRDQNSKANNRKTGDADTTKHWLTGNSDFNFIYSKFDDDNVDTTSYVEKRLPIKIDYLNSRLKNWPPKKLIIGNNLNRRKQWPLPYRSTIVVPIVPLLADDQNQQALRGFLCIDSPNESSFYEKVDVNILKGVADGIYRKIDIINELTSEPNE